MVEPSVTQPPGVRFGSFELTLNTGELKKDGTRINLHGQPIEILTLLLQTPGELVTREELRQKLWSKDTFVDFEHGLNAAVKRLRAALADDADAPRYIETIPRRGYRFVAQVERSPTLSTIVETTPAPAEKPSVRATRWRIAAAALVVTGLVVATAYLAVSRNRPAQPSRRTLTRVTFDSGFQHWPTWSPDGRFIAYGSAGPTQDVWVQPVAGGNPVQVTKDPARDWQPDWSPDGTQIVFRSERDGGGLYLVPVLGGQERKLTSFGAYPQWSPDGSRVLFAGALIPTRLYTVALDGSPPRELAPELSSQVQRVFGRWHPDGRVSVFTLRGEREWSFWTLALDGGSAVKSGLAPDVTRRYEESDLQPEMLDFDWAPSGDAIFFSGNARGIRNIWKISVDPKTLRWISGPEQITFSQGDDVAVAVSPDGKKLAFNMSTETTRLWTFPLVDGRVTGNPEPLTPEGWLPSDAGLTRDGRKLAFMARRRGERTGRYEVWQKELDDGSERLLLADSAPREELRWSPDGARLAYSRDAKITIYDTKTAEEQPLPSAAGRTVWVMDWSPDGTAITAAGPGDDPNRPVLWLFPVSPDGRPTGAGRVVASRRDHAIYQNAVSPDGRWICFEAVDFPDHRTARLYIVSTAGGPWIPVTDGGHWDDKPRWAPDGRTIYFLSNRAADAFFFHLWAVRFDTGSGRVVGNPFRVPNADIPEHYISLGGPDLAVALASNRLVLSARSISGNVWVLDGVDR